MRDAQHTLRTKFLKKQEYTLIHFIKDKQMHIGVTHNKVPNSQSLTLRTLKSSDSMDYKCQASINFLLICDKMRTMQQVFIKLNMFNLRTILYSEITPFLIFEVG